MSIQVYFRTDRETIAEKEVCSQWLTTVDLRTQLKASDAPVICRFSALPYYKELEQDLLVIGCKPINSSQEHDYIAEMAWLYDLEGLTFKTWDRLEQVPNDTPLVVKGKTNSRKFEWNSKMYAPNKEAAMNIMHELWHDPLIGPQGVVFRKYTPLKTYEIGVNGMPMTNEWRCFFYKKQLVDAGFYWSSLHDLSVIDHAGFEKQGLEVAQEAANRLSDFTSFFVVDVAQGIDGRWHVVEINDGQMSGLSMIEPQGFYQKLKNALSLEHKQKPRFN